MSVIGVAAAAERLRVHPRSVQLLVARGQLRQVTRGAIDEASVERYLASRTGVSRRTWEQSTAWAAVALLSGSNASWLGMSQRSRLRARLRGMDAEQLVGHVRNRAVVHRFSGHLSVLDAVRAKIVDTGDAAAALGLADSHAVDGYLAADAVGALADEYGLIEDDAGNITLRATDMDLGVVADLAKVSSVLAAIDLAESLNVRERRAGIDGIHAALKAFNV